MASGMMHHYHHKHNQGLCLMTCSFKAQDIPDLCIIVYIIPYSVALMLMLKDYIWQTISVHPSRDHLSFSDIILYLPTYCPPIIYCRSQLLWRSNTARTNSGLKYLICASPSLGHLPYLQSKSQCHTAYPL